MQYLNKKFGKLTIIAKTNKKYHGSPIYICRCDCGNQCEAIIDKLKNGSKKSCGCSRYRSLDLTGQIINGIKILEKLNSQGASKFRCKCFCGNEFEAKGTKLKNRYIRSCGCLSSLGHKNLTSYTKDVFYEGTNISSISSSRALNKNNTTGVRGVTWNSKKQKYIAQIMFQRKTYNLGYFDNLADAARARSEAEQKLYAPVIDSFHNKKVQK